MADKNMVAKITVVDMEEPPSRQTLNDGDSINKLFGKIKKVISDLKAVAFSGSYTDLKDTPAEATPTQKGFMSAPDKTKLDGIAAGATAVTKTSDLENDSGFVTADRVRNPNLLDNWYFADPINQRGKTEYEGQVYTIDRWIKEEEGVVGVSDSGVSFPWGGVGTNGLYQMLENYEQLKQRFCTFSLLDADGLHSVTFIMGNHWGGSQLGGMSFYSTPYQHCLIRYYKNLSTIAVKLELGDQQTLAHQDANGNWILNDPPPNKALELLKCQRYYQRGTFMGPILMENSWGPLYSSHCTFPVEMRTNPAVRVFSALGDGTVEYYFDQEGQHPVIMNYDYSHATSKYYKAIFGLPPIMADNAIPPRLSNNIRFEYEASADL